MDSFRIFAGMVFAISVFLLVDAWVRDHQKAVTPVATATAPKEIQHHQLQLQHWVKRRPRPSVRQTPSLPKVSASA